MANASLLVRKGSNDNISRFQQYFIRVLCFIVLFAWYPAVAGAQATDEKVQMAEGMRSSGKIYVVVAVLLTVLAGLILYLVRLDRKISHFEKQAGK